MAGFSGDGGSATAAKINYVGKVFVDSASNVYLADNGNERIRVIDQSGLINTTVGTGAAGYSGDGGSPLAAQLNAPSGVVVDALGNLYIADRANHRVRKVHGLVKIKDSEIGDCFRTWPCPANSMIFIDSSEPIDRVDLIAPRGGLLEIYDGTTRNINVSQIPNGLYLVKVYSGKNDVYRKILVQH